MCYRWVAWIKNEKGHYQDYISKVMAQQLTGKRVAIVVTDGFEQDELETTRQALEEAGATTEIVSPKSGKVKAWKYTGWGTEFKIDKAVEQADPNQYDALMLPAGQMVPDSLRMNQKVMDFVGSFVRAGKPIAALWHSPWTLIEAKGLLRKPYLTPFLPRKDVKIEHQKHKGEQQGQFAADPKLDYGLTELIRLSREVDINALGRSVLHFIKEKLGTDAKDQSRIRDKTNLEGLDYVFYVNVQRSSSA